MDLKHVDETFQKLQTDAAAGYQKVYHAIRSQLKGSGSRGLGGEIARLEAKALNQLVIASMDHVEQAVIAEMTANGCKEYLTQAGWTEIQQAAGVPHMEFCRVQVDITPAADSEARPGMTDSVRRELKKRISQYESARKMCAGTAVAGTAVSVVTLFIPGWEFPVQILFWAGVVMAVIGGGGAIYSGAQMNQARSKFERGNTPVRTVTSYEEQLDLLLAQVTDSQCKRNLHLYCEWLDKVKQALISECDKLSAM